MRQILLSTCLFFFIEESLRAQYDQLPLPPPGATSNPIPRNGYPAVIRDTPGNNGNQPLTECPEMLGEPPWCEPPYEPTRWRVDIGFNPTTSRIKDGSHRFVNDDWTSA